MSTKITNNLKVHGESTTQKYTDAQYNTDTQRINGAQPGTPISSKLINTGLRNATLVTSALIEALKTVVPNSNDLTTAITVGAATTHAALVTALTEALVKIKVENAVLADNIRSGSIVEEATTARESKQGFGISLGLNSKLQFKTTWLGTHKNNDVVYYSAAGALKGFYIVKGLSAETTSQAAGTLTITSGQTPTTHAANLQRLTFETAISVDTGLSKTDIINSSSTTNQLATAKAVYDYTQANFVLADETLITTISNGGTVLLSTLTAYRSIRIELRRKSTSSATGTFYGDVKEFKAANIFTRVEIAGTKYWSSTQDTNYDGTVTDESITSSGNLINHLNSIYPAVGYSVGYAMRGNGVTLPVEYYYAKVLQGSVTYMYGGVRLEQFDGSTLTFATFARTSNTVVTLVCNTNYELIIYGKL